MTSATVPSSPTIRLRSARDVLAAVPYLLGFRPAECVVVAGVDDRGRLPLLARTALDDLCVPDDGERVVRTLAARAADVRVRRAVVAVCTARPLAAGTRLRRGVDRLVTALETVGETDPWLVTPDGYRGLDCADPLCCPPAGHPLDDLVAGEVSAAFVLSGRAVAASEAEAFRVPRAGAEARTLAARAAGRWERAGARAQEPDAARRWRQAGLRAWEEATRHAATELLAGDVPPAVRLSPALLGRVAAALADTPVRDAVLLTLVPGAQEVARRTVRGAPEDEVGAATAEAVARVVDPRVGLRPQEVTVGPARAVLEAVAGHVPRRLQPPALTLLGLLAWWQGDGGLAGHRVRAALALDPGYRLAALLGGVLTAALPPGWVRRVASGAPDGRDAGPPTPDGGVG